MLALRFADRSHGVVRLDGHEVSDVTLRSLRENVALLLQEAPLFGGTVWVAQLAQQPPLPKERRPSTRVLPAIRAQRLCDTGARALGARA